MRLTQLINQLRYRFFDKKISNQSFPLSIFSLRLDKKIRRKEILFNQTFKLLNSSYSFNDTVDWNLGVNGKLWTYNLNYFDFLHQENMTKEEGLKLILDFCSNSQTIRDGYEPYPISLRGINWIKFLSIHQIDDERINTQLYTDYRRLLSRIEYHILANHLFENGFSLLFGAYYFRDEKLYNKAQKIIRSQLKEQLLSDGAHYELTPMYHQIILYRILDCYQLIVNNPWKQFAMARELKEAAEKMLGWLKAIEFNNGDVPMVNDSTQQITPTSDELLDYAASLGIYSKAITLGESGYRTFKTTDFELFIDVGQIAPSYQPGHSHADSLQLLLHHANNPILVDTGISTYEKNARRQLERSTESHNSVTINRKNSSDVWSGFRVGRRAKVTVLEETKNTIRASHDGYRKRGIIHERFIQIIASEGILITDKISGAKDSDILEGHLHFSPDINPKIVKNQVLLNPELVIIFDQEVKLHHETYEFCLGFNKRVTATKLIYQFNGSITFKIKKRIVL